MTKYSSKTLDLNGSWTVRATHPTTIMTETIPAHVPGTVHHDLLQAGIIDDPFVGENELEQQWIGAQDWCYERYFYVDETMLCAHSLELVCDGLDTIATVSINGHPIGDSDNMFRPWRWCVRDALIAGDNHISITFSAASTWSQKQERLHGVLHTDLSAPHEKSGRSYMRKEQCNFGWDWGPVLVTCGIWKSIRLETSTHARIDDVHIQQQHRSRKRVDLTIALHCETWSRQKHFAQVRISHNGHTIATKTCPITRRHATCTITLNNPDLWWPAGMGDQALYNVDITLQDAEKQTLDHWQERVGLRTLALIREQDEWGESFTFACNGKRFFAKGSNWIPADAIKDRVTDERLNDLLSSAVAVNMNMIRVWGGGLYESDHFYDTCDELGLCVWQDFMFACSAYPAHDTNFMASVKAEAEHQIRRLRHHACLALWCGNNELEMLVVNHNYMPLADYTALFDQQLAKLVKRYNPDTAYWPSSPHTPQGDRNQGNDERCGDAHLWEVWHGEKPFEWYRGSFPRFCSEFGFQSFPEPRSVSTYTSNTDETNITSAVMEHHQRSDIGNTRIIQYMASWFPMPKDSTALLWLSQIQQGLAITYAVEHWRQNMQRCRGALYWQLNDCWPTASWSSIDYFHRWKALHFMTKRFFAPLMISGVEDANAGTVNVFVANDHQQTQHAELRWTVGTTDGNTIDSGIKSIRIGADRSRTVCTINCRRALATHGPRAVLVWLELWQDETCVSQKLVHFVKPKHMRLAPVRYQTKVSKLGPQRFAVDVHTDKPALWAWLSLDDYDARWNDNFICLTAKQTYRFIANTEQDLSITRFRQQLHIRSIRDCF